MARGSNIPELLGKGLYSPAEAARLVGISSSRARRRIQGYRFEYETRAGKRRSHSAPIIHTDLPKIGELVAVSFLELIELRVVAAFLRRGVPMRKIRRAFKHASRILEVGHPFALQKFKTDGKGIFMNRDEFHVLLELSGGQYAFPEILNDYLDQIEFDDVTDLAKRWWPLGRNKPIVIDPAVAFGTPVISGTRIPVRTILDALKAGETKKAVCGWYDIPSQSVTSAIAFGQQQEAA